MAKNYVSVTETEDQDVFNFDDIYNENEDESMLAMQGILKTSTDQMRIALDLTRMIVENSDNNNREEQVFSVFQKAIKVVHENFPLKKIIDQLTIMEKFEADA